MLALWIFYFVDFCIVIFIFYKYLLPYLKNIFETTFFKEKTIWQEKQKFIKDLVFDHKHVKNIYSKKDNFKKEFEKITDKLLSEYKIKQSHKLKKELKNIFLNFEELYEWTTKRLFIQAFKEFVQDFVEKSSISIRKGNLQEKEIKYIIESLKNVKQI